MDFFEQVIISPVYNVGKIAKVGSTKAKAFVLPTLAIFSDIINRADDD